MPIFKTNILREIKMLENLILAAEVAMPRGKNDPRHFWLGCIGIRRDGTMVTSQNAAVYSSSPTVYQPISLAHAEGRVLRKLGKGGTVFVARVSKLNYTLAMAMPCEMCQTKIRAANAERVYFTINDREFGLWIPAKNTFTTFPIRKSLNKIKAS